MAKKELGFNITKSDRGLSIEITDNGSGIEDVDKIFEMFYTTKELGDGTGLGLAMSAHLVRLMGGELRVVSEPGKGSEFYFVLPFE